MDIKAFFDKRTYTVTYVVYDAESGDALVIDPVMDFEPASAKIWTESVQIIIDFIKEKKLNLRYILETHAHADHLSGAQLLKKNFPEAQTGINENIRTVQALFKGVFDLPDSFPTDGSQFDVLFSDNQVIEAGSIKFKVINTPGHTPSCTTFQIEDAIFTGDAIFMPDMGTGRCDFPAGSASDLYDSITNRLYTLPDETRVFVGHDYMPGGRELAWETTIAAQKAANIQLPEGRNREEYIEFRTARDQKLNAPRLLFQSVQINIDAGHLPKVLPNEIRYLRIPINVFRPDPAGKLELQDV